uniref:Female-specific orf protein n=1 Tax=Fusconaia flava TaxID=96912 RepID=F4ZFF6_FUSFL|nr:female-specific orf protein [Fusconaia flava]AEC14040.1 female-specific orf protein [Fusconaia flava]AEC14041.1 female-specific orf protein [Fusconaia flava]
MDFSRQKSMKCIWLPKLLVITKFLTRVTKMLQHKTVQKSIILLLTSLLMVILFPSLLSAIPESASYVKPSLIDNPLENNQPTDTTPTSTGSHPLKNSPASTDISDKV